MKTVVDPWRKTTRQVNVAWGLVVAGWLSVMVSTCPAQSPKAEPQPNRTSIYATWDGYQEVDRCATAWLIKKFGDQDARFKLYPHGTAVMEGEPFDVPLAASLRKPNQTVFFSYYLQFELTDEGLLAIDRIIRDIELNTWAPKITAEAVGLETLIRGLNVLYLNKEECIEKSFLFFDALYAAFSRKE